LLNKNTTYGENAKSQKEKQAMDPKHVQKNWDSMAGNSNIQKKLQKKLKLTGTSAIDEGVDNAD
jgi:hypothetical protein